MTYHLKFTTTYKKSYKLMKKRGLSSNFSGFRECHIKPDWLLIYLIENDILTLTLVDTGSHSDIFKR